MQLFHRLFWLVLFCPIVLIGQKIDAYQYLKLDIEALPESRLLLKETYTKDKSKESKYKKKYLSSREEYNEEGRRSLNLFYNPKGELESKIVAYYPAPRVEKNIYQQRGGYIDSTIFLYNERGQRISEIWYWGENGSSDTLTYTYNAAGSLTKVLRKYDWETKWDTLFYSSENTLDKSVSYSKDNGYQKQVDFFFGSDGTLLKTSIRNSQRMIVQEEFFFYSEKGIEKTVSRYYPEDNEWVTPPRMLTKYKYYKNSNTLKQIEKSFYNRKKNKVAYSLFKYNKQGNLIFQYDSNRTEGINKKVKMVYTVRKKKKLKPEAPTSDADQNKSTD